MKEGIIRTPLNALETFKDDPLRVLRAIRFSARFGFQLSPEVESAAKQKEIQVRNFRRTPRLSLTWRLHYAGCVGYKDQPRTCRD